MPATNNVSKVGQKLDIAELIAVADMKNTPFTTMVGKEKQAKAALFSNQADGYDDPKTTGAIDGKDVSEYEDGAKHRALITGRVQIFERTASVTTTKEAIAQAGGQAAVKSEMAASKAKKTIEYKRDQEATNLSDNDSLEDNGAKGGQTRGACKWVSATAQADQPVRAEFRPDAGCIYTGTLAGFTEEAMNSLLQKRWEKVGFPSGVLTGMLGSEIKKAVSGFTRYATDKAGQTSVRFYNMKDATTYSAVVDFFEGDFAGVELHLASFLPSQLRGLILDMDRWALYSLKRPAWKDLEDKGGGPRALLQGIAGLMCENPLGEIKIEATA